MSSGEEGEQKAGRGRAPDCDPGNSSIEADSYCPVCSQPLLQEKCKVVCRSASCIYRLIFNCSEF